MTPELLEIWESTDEDVRQEVARVIKMAESDSEMYDDSHPKNQQFNDAFAVIIGIIED